LSTLFVVVTCSQRAPVPGSGNREDLVYWKLFKTNNSLVDAYPGENEDSVTNVEVKIAMQKFIELVSIPAIVTSWY